MDNSELLAYLKTWVKLNATSVYGSGQDFVKIDSLVSELDKLEEWVNQ